MKYRERLAYLKLSTLKYRRARGDMIEVYKIVTHKYESLISPCIARNEQVKTRGTSLKLKVERSKYDLRKYSFTSRIVNLWNSLPESVISADSTNIFKNRLDKFWLKQEVFYDYKSDFVMSGSVVNIV